MLTTPPHPRVEGWLRVQNFQWGAPSQKLLFAIIFAKILHENDKYDQEGGFQHLLCKSASYLFSLLFQFLNEN